MLSDANLISTLLVDIPNLTWFHQGSLDCICLLSKTRKCFFGGNKGNCCELLRVWEESSEDLVNGVEAVVILKDRR